VSELSMTTKEVRILNAEILETLGEQAGLVAIGQDAPLTADQMRLTLESALARHLSPHGGVVLTWWNPVDGLRMNALPIAIPRGDGDG